MLCLIKRPISTLDCVLLQDNNLIFTVLFRPEISFRASLRVLLTPSFQSSSIGALSPSSPHRHTSSVYQALFYNLSKFPVNKHSFRFPNEAFVNFWSCILTYPPLPPQKIFIGRKYLRGITPMTNRVFNECFTCFCFYIPNLPVVLYILVQHTVSSNCID